jgi:proteasome lid subunit RPN8/RPN11
MRASSGQLLLGGHVLASIREHAEATYPEEACGGLLGRAGEDGTVQIVEAVTLANSRDEQRDRRYLIGPDDVLSLERRAAAAGLHVVGYFHSHPDAPAVPSGFDREHAWPWYIYMIVSVLGGSMTDARAWRLSGDRESFEGLTINDTGHVTTEIEGS